MNISIIIFCHNERDNIENVIQSVQKMVDIISSDYEIILVDDGSTDGTTERVKAIKGIKIICHPVNEGIGRALRTGYSSATKEFVCAIPGDGQFDVNELLQIKPFDRNTFYSFFRPHTNYTPYRKFLNLSNRLFNRVFLNIKLQDVNWIKVYRTDQLKSVNIELNSSIIESEICAKLISIGCNPIELPSVYHDRKSGESKGGNWKTLSMVIREMLSLFLIVRRFKKKL